jgi:hypothetical protein
MLTKWSLKRHGVYLFYLYKVDRYQNRYKKKDGEGGKTLRDWKFWHDLISQQGKGDVILLYLV